MPLRFSRPYAFDGHPLHPLRHSREGAKKDLTALGLRWKISSFLANRIMAGRIDRTSASETDLPILQ
jgi:hypothetical protein